MMVCRFSHKKTHPKQQRHAAVSGCGIMMRGRITQQTLELEILTKKSIEPGKKLVNIF